MTREERLAYVQALAEKQCLKKHWGPELIRQLGLKLYALAPCQDCRSEVAATLDALFPPGPDRPLTPQEKAKYRGRLGPD